MTIEGPAEEMTDLLKDTESPYLLKNKLYVFRIGVRSNPSVTPNPNTWSIDISGESSVAFPGFTLWTFTTPVFLVGLDCQDFG